MSSELKPHKTRSVALRGNQNAYTIGDYSRATPPDRDDLTRRAMAALANGDTAGLREIRRVMRYHGHTDLAASIKKLARKVRQDPAYNLTVLLHTAERIEAHQASWPQ